MIALTALCVAFVCAVIAWERIEAQSAATLISSDRLEKASSVGKLVALNDRRFETFAFDYATWDDMVNYVDKPTYKWVHENVDSEFPIYHIDRVWIFDSKKAPLHSATAPGLGRLTQITIPPEGFSAASAHHTGVKFYLSTPLGPLEVFGATVRPTGDLHRTLPLSGYFFVGRLVDNGYLSELATLSDCRVSIAPFVRTVTNSSQSFRQLMLDANGNPVGQFNFVTESSAADLIHSAHQNAISLFIIFSLLVLLSTFWAVLRWISTPLDTISSSLVAEDPRPLRSLTRAGTEFGQLARLVTAFFQQKAELETQMHERIRVEGELRAAREDLERRVDERTTELQATNRSLSDEIAERNRVEDALREAEEKYRGIFEHTLEGIYQTTPDGRYLNANPALARIYGYDSPEELTSNLTDISSKLYVCESRRNRFKEVVEAEGVISGFESEVYRKDGSITWISENGRVVRDDDGSILYYEGTVEDVSERKRAELEIFRLNAHLEERLGRIVSQRRIDAAINSSHELGKVIHVFLKEVTGQLRVDAAAVMTCDSSAFRLKYVASTGFNFGPLRQTHMPLGSGYAGQAALERRTIQIDDLSQDGGAFTAAQGISREGFVSYFAVPLVAKGSVKGVLEVFHRTHLEPDQEWLDFLDALASQAAIAIDNASLFEGLQRTNIELSIAYDATIEGWSRALDLRDKETEGHSQRVTEMTIRLAEQLGVSDADLVHIRRGALLHDIGKMGIPDQILLKPGPLSDHEWVIMRKHPVYAYEMLSPVEFLRPALDIPYCHHEKWDGTGYPRGLSGENIPLAARIFGIVDVWDALRSDRPYRPGWSTERIKEHIRENSGKHFDPNVAKAFLELVDGEEFMNLLIARAA
ncbi:MAG TPA: HD domain-containing phosphohydrolase [Capsulimonadaceae bacterium]|jgi:PAS domain S-box-containing protein/putative nucleotidyltransferase with HDIG domain